MAIVKDDALVLGRRRFGETSLIVSLFTPTKGPVRVIAKGARRARSKFGSALEPTNVLRIVYYAKENRDLHLLSQADPIQTFSVLRESLLRLAYAYAIIDCLIGLKRDESVAGPLFGMARAALEHIDRVPDEDLEGSLWSFLLGALEDAGFRPELDRCLECGRDAGSEALSFHARSGGILCRRHGIGGLSIGEETRSVLGRCARGEAGIGIMSPRIIAEGREVLRGFIREHGLGRQPFRALEELIRGPKGIDS